MARRRQIRQAGVLRLVGEQGAPGCSDRARGFRRLRPPSAFQARLAKAIPMPKPGETNQSAAAPVTTVRLQNIAQSYGQSAALMAAVEIGLFTAISKGAGTYDEVARAVDIHPTNAERLMVMLCAAGLLEISAGRH